MRRGDLAGNNEKLVAHQLPTSSVNLFDFNKTIGLTTFRRNRPVFDKTGRKLRFTLGIGKSIRLDGQDRVVGVMPAAF